MALRILPILGVLLSLAVGDALGQSLAELAEKEKKRREELRREGAEETAVFTNEDLSGGERAPEGDEPSRPVRSRAGRPAERNDDEPDGDREDTAGAEDVDDESHLDGGERAPASAEAGEEHWRARARKLREDVEAAERHLAEVEEEHRQRVRSPMSPPRPTDDDTGRDPTQAFTKDARSTELENELKQARETLERARAAWDAFRQEARRKRVPPGWIR